MNQMAIWMDHHEARIFHVDAQTFDEKTLSSVTSHIHRHEKGAEVKDRNHPDDERRFFADIAQALSRAEQVLVMGPSVAKVQFVNHLKEHHAPLAAKIVGVESADHPTDKQIVAHVRKYFHVSAPRLGTGA